MTQRVPISDSGAPDGIAVRAPMVAVGPVGQIKVEDVGLGAAQFDAWVRYVSGGLVGLESLQSVTTCAPVMGNLIAVVGALGNIAGLSEMPTHKPLDWVDLAINLIGLLPTPENQAHARLSLRPALFLVRQEMQQSGASGNAKGALGDGQVALLMGHLNATIKGELSNFIERAQGYLPAMLQQGGQVGCDLTLALAAGLEQAAALPPMASITQDIATRILNDSQATIDNVFKATWDVYKAAGCPESHAEAFAPLTPHEAQQALALTVAGLRRFATTIPPALQDLANPDMPGGPGWLLTTLLEAVASWRTRHGTGQSVNIKSDATTQAVRIASEGELGAVSFEEIARGDCSSCGEPVKADTDHSISFARGTERLSQTDWALPGPFPFSWTRTYRSNLAAFDDSSCGARWITPYTTRVDIVQAGADRPGLRYHAIDGRSHDYPFPQVGKAHYDPIENLTLVRTTKTTLILARGYDYYESYQQDGQYFRLTEIRLRGGARLRLFFTNTRLPAARCFPIL